MLIYKHIGFTIIETIFVLIVVSIIVLLGINQYHRYTLNKDLEQIRYNVALISQAVNDYYRSNYKANSAIPIPFPLPPDPGNLKPEMEKWWPKLFLKGNNLTPSDDDYNVAVEQIHDAKTKTYNYKFQVQVKLHLADSQSINWYQNVLGASGLKSNTNLFWTVIPNYSIEKINTNLWPAMQQLQQFTNYISGKYTKDQL